VDPLSHVLFGRTLALTVDRTSSRGIPAALVIGSILPDADAILAPVRFDLYLNAHVSGTHSLFGTVLEALALTLVLRRVIKGSRAVILFIASCVGLLGHVFWDLVDGSDIEVLRPFRDSTFGWHLVSMAEPAVLSCLAGAVLLAWWWPRRARAIAAATLTLLSVFLLSKMESQHLARKQYVASLGAEAPPSFAVAPQFGRLFSWNVYARSARGVQAWTVDSWTGRVDSAFVYQDASAQPSVEWSRRLPVVRTFLGLAMIPFARVADESGQRFVFWSDATSCSADGCDVSFGAAVDDRMAPLFQVIQIGSYQQRRALGGVR
jgi:membrane-bound metal-dependent hydrolase YbcI (DUF457 family)